MGNYSKISHIIDEKLAQVNLGRFEQGEVRDEPVEFDMKEALASKYNQQLSLLKGGSLEISPLISLESSWYTCKYLMKIEPELGERRYGFFKCMPSKTYELTVVNLPFANHEEWA